MSEFRVSSFFTDNDGGEEVLFEDSFLTKESAENAFRIVRGRALDAAFDNLNDYPEYDYKESDNGILFVDRVTGEQVCAWTYFLNEYPTVDEVLAEFAD